MTVDRWTEDQLREAWQQWRAENPLPEIDRRMKDARERRAEFAGVPGRRAEIDAEIARLQAERAAAGTEHGKEWDVLEAHRRDIQRAAWHAKVDTLRDRLLLAGETVGTDVDTVLDDVLDALLPVADAYAEAHAALRTGDPDVTQRGQRRRYGESLRDLGRVLKGLATRYEYNHWAG